MVRRKAGDGGDHQRKLNSRVRWRGWTRRVMVATLSDVKSRQVIALEQQSSLPRLFA